MNYQHGFHAGGFSDVLKHATLANLMAALSAKDKPYLIIDTHGGRGGYDLGDQGSVTMEWKMGIGRLLPMRQPPPALVDYIRVVRAYDKKFGNFNIKPAEGVRHYPGSPRIARALLRPDDRLVVAELNPREAIFLKREFAGDKGIDVREEDGYGLLKSMLPPPERRALVLIDPPYEFARRDRERGGGDRPRSAPLRDRRLRAVVPDQGHEIRSGAARGGDRARPA